ncbi:MAG: TIGR01777 family oxidoreductase [Parachlamydiaceae bacterium]
MQIAIAGASGLVGSALVPFLEKGDHVVIPLKRESDQLYHLHDLTPDVVINLSGENIASRWSEEKKKKIRDSRVRTTEMLAREAATSKNPPKLFLNASAIGYYGNREEVTLDESASKGSGFLSDVVEAWERALQPLKAAKIRTVAMRFGVVLSQEGGALAKMLTPFKLGMGGPVGSGKQFMSWIAIDDILGAIHHAITEERLEGAVNFVAPHPERNGDFVKTLGAVLGRPAIVPMPEWSVKLLFGEMGQEILLSGAKVEPKKLLDSGYPFLYPDLNSALVKILGRE